MSWNAEQQDSNMSDEQPLLENPDPSPAQLMEAVKYLATQYGRTTDATKQLSDEMARRRAETRRRDLAFFFAGIVLIVAALIVRSVDLAHEREKQERVTEALHSQRDDQVAGCERANDVRRLVREEYEITHSPSPPPDLLPPDLLPLWEELQGRTLQERALLLSRPGVQIVDCLKAFPPPAVGR